METAKSTANEFKKNLGDIKDNVASKMDKDAWSDTYKEVQAKAQDAVSASQDFIKSNPLYTIAGAAAIGFVAGMLLRGGKKH